MNIIVVQIILFTFAFLLLTFFILTLKKNIKVSLVLLTSSILLIVLASVNPNTINNLIFSINYVSGPKFELLRYTYSENEIKEVLQKIDIYMNKINNQDGSLDFNDLKKIHKEKTFLLQNAKNKEDYLKNELDYVLLASDEMYKRNYYKSLEYIYKGLAISTHKNITLFLNMQLSYAYMFLKKYDIAKTIIDKILYENPESYEGLRSLASYYEIKRDPLADKYFKLAIKSSPDNESLMEAYSGYLINNNKLVEAEAILEKLNKTSDTYNFLGLIYLKRKEYDIALIHFKKAIGLDKENFYALVKIGEIYSIKGKMEEAIKCLKDAIKIKPFAYAYFKLGVIEKNKKVSKDYYTKALELDQFHSYSNLNISNIYFNENNLEMFFKHIFLINSNENETLSLKYNNLAFNLDLIRGKKYDDFIENLYKKSLKIDNQNIRAYLNYGVFLNTVRKDIEKAKKIYKKGLKFFPNDARLYNNLGNITSNKYEKLKLLKKAILLDNNYYTAFQNLCNATNDETYCRRMNELK